MVASKAPRKLPTLGMLLARVIEEADRENPAMARLLRSAVKEYSAKMAKINAVSF